MFKAYKNIVLASFGFCLLMACHKYKHDPGITLMSPYSRSAGTWHLEQYIVDGVDSTANYLSHAIMVCDIRFSNRVSGYCKIANSTDCRTSIQYQFSYLCYGFNGNLLNIWNWFVYPLNSTSGNQTSFTVDRLYKEDLWLSLDINGKHYIGKFKKIKGI